MPPKHDSATSTQANGWISDAIAKEMLITTIREKQRNRGSSKSAIHQNADSLEKSSTKRSSPVEKDDVEVVKVKRAGRKAIGQVSKDFINDPKQKRKEQNRAAQRAFRERKERHLTELYNRIRELEKQNEIFSNENEALKLQIKQLQEEKYALKGTQFTFECKPTPNGSCEANTRLPESTIKNPSISGYSSTGSSNYSTHGSDEEPTPLDTDFTHATYPENTLSFDTLAANNNPLFTDYRVPADEDSLFFQSEELPPLFGTDLGVYDLFDQDLSEDGLQQKLPSEPDGACRNMCRFRVVETLLKAKGQSRRVSEVQREVWNYCPNVNLDELCEKLKNTKCYDEHILTDKEVECIIDRFERQEDP